MPANAVKGPFPSYERPPVVETVLGVQFDRLPRARNAHWGAFWKTLDPEEWPEVGDASLLPAQFEQFEAKAAWARAVQLQLTQDPSCRLRITNADKNRMIQVQNSRLHFNWLGQQGGKYPRYSKVRDGFLSTLSCFVAFVTAEELGEFAPNQWEVTYVNQIPRGTVWNTPDDWGFFKPLGGVPTIENVVDGESFGGEWHFVIPPKQGRLHIAWQYGKGATAGPGGTEDFIRITLTARGPILPTSDGIEAISEGLDLGRATIVRSFHDLMSDEANHHWGLNDSED